MSYFNFLRDREGNSHVLKYKLDKRNVVNYQVEMINNAIDIDFINIKIEEEFLIYDITSLIPIKTYFQNYCDIYSRTKDLFITIIESISKSENYLLDLENICINESSIYFDVINGKPRFIYTPIENSKSETIHEMVQNTFLKLLMKNIGVDTIYNESNYKNMIEQLQDRNFDIYIFKELLKIKKMEVVKKNKKIKWWKKIKNKHSIELEEKKIIITNTIENKEKNQLIKCDPTIMIETIEKLPYLDFYNDKKIVLSKDRFLIGRSKELVDYALSEELAIGRVHAEILREESCYYLVDINSKNGTYINGIRLESQKKYELKSGDEVQFAEKKSKFI